MTSSLHRDPIMDADTTNLAAALLLGDDPSPPPAAPYGPYQTHYASSSTSPSSGDEEPPPAGPVPVPTNSVPTLPSSTWLQWESGAAPTLDISAHLPEGALALRRQKNRESMRRARQRQRDQLQTLRDAVADLERQYARLSTQVEQARSTGSAASRAIEDARALTRRLGAENLLLRATLQDQQDWKLEMRRVFETMGYLLGGSAEKAVAFEDEGDGRGGRGKTLPLPPSSSSAADSEVTRQWGRTSPPSSAALPAPLRERLEVLSAFEAESVFGFHPVSTREVKDLILENSRVVASVQSLLLGEDPTADPADGGASPSGSDHEGAASPPPALGRLNLEDDPNALHMDVFDWDVRQLVRGPEMLFTFTKRFPTLAVAEVMQRAWTSELTLSGLQKVKYDTIALAPLQVVGENTVVLGRDVRSPDENPLFRTTLLRYRIETTREVPRDEGDGDGPPLVGSGFIIGTQSLNPHKHAGAVLAPDMATLYRGRAEDGRADGTPVGSRLVWADLMYSIEFLSVVDPADGDGAPPKYAQVRWAGKTNYGTPFDARRNTSDKLSSLLHWELQNIAPAVQFIYSSE